MEKMNSVLIVDDDTSNLMELASILRQEYKIYAFKDGVSALEKANESLPDLILLDVVMADMNGFEVISALKKSDKTKDIPVIFITGVNESESEREGLAIGAVDYIRKPFDAMVVKHRVRLQIQIINLQRDLKNAAEVADAANRSKSTFLANMSHEIRTPMNAIMGVTDILMQNENLSHDKITEGLDKIYASSEMLLSLINDILDFSKIEAGKLDIMSAEYKIANMINDAIHLNLMRIGKKPIMFKLDIKENIPAKFIGDELRIKQILNNLLSNAFKYTDAGNVTLSVICELEELGKEDITLVLSVQDTGRGMTKEQLDKLFDEYSRFNEKSNRTIEGTGLGLSIMRRLVNLMGGTIHVESELDKGTAVTIRLPQRTVGAGILGEEAAKNLRQFRQSNMTHRENTKFMREPMPYGRVLIVDDMENNLFVAVNLMKPYKIQIETASNGREAIEKIKNSKVYDIIFMDHMMPEMDGIEATKHLRDLGYADPIIALTANAVVGQADALLQNGFDAFMSKPIDIRQLDAILNKFICDKQPLEVIENARQQVSNIKINNENGIQPRMDFLLLDSLVRDVRKAVDVLEELCEKMVSTLNEEDLWNLTITAHGIKSSLKNIGESELSEFASKLEQASRERNSGIICLSIPGLTKELRMLLEKFEMISEIEGIDVINEDSDTLRNELLVIKEMCAGYNRKGALGIIYSMVNYSKETKSVLEKIKEYVFNGDFEEAESAAAEYLSGLAPVDGQPPEDSRTVTLLADKELAGFDIGKGLERYDNNERIYLKLLRSYAVTLRSLLRAINTVNEDNLADYKLKVHSIKGTSLEIFADKLGNAAAELEQAATAGDLNYINEHNPAFLQDAWKIINDIDAMLLDISAENPKPKKDMPDNELLSHLVSACEMYNLNGVNEAMGEIEKYQYESDDGLAGWLREKVDIMDYEQIVEKLSNL